jgi:uncharacterized protein YciI
MPPGPSIRSRTRQRRLLVEYGTVAKQRRLRLADPQPGALRAYLERDEMVVFGPVLTDEDSYGLAVVETDDEQALREFASQDPVVTSGTAALELGLSEDLCRHERKRRSCLLPREAER